MVVCYTYRLQLRPWTDSYKAMLTCQWWTGAWYSLIKTLAGWHGSFSTYTSTLPPPQHLEDLCGQKEVENISKNSKIICWLIIDYHLQVVAFLIIKRLKL